MAFPDLGEPLTGSYTIPDGTARLFTNGVTIQHGGGEVIVAFRLPTLGRPSIVSLDPPTPLFEPNAISFNAAGHDPRAVARLIADALAGRLVLAATGQAGQQIPEEATDSACLRIAPRTPPREAPERQLRCTAREGGP